jgi:hypothetical protein
MWLNTQQRIATSKAVELRTLHHNFDTLLCQILSKLLKKVVYTPREVKTLLLLIFLSSDPKLGPPFS